MNKANMTPTEVDRIADLCETAFQNGGPKVYTFDQDKPWKVSPSAYSAKRTLELWGNPGVSVWQRRKGPNGYRFVCTGSHESLTREAMGRLILEASTGIHGEAAAQLARECARLAEALVTQRQQLI